MLPVPTLHEFAGRSGTCLSGRIGRNPGISYGRKAFARRRHRKTMKQILALGLAFSFLLANPMYGQATGPAGSNASSGEMTGTIKEYTPGTSLVLETLAPTEPVQFKLAKTVTFNDTDGKTIEAAGLTTNRKVRVHYSKVGGDYVADKVSLLPN